MFERVHRTQRKGNIQDSQTLLIPSSVLHPFMRCLRTVRAECRYARPSKICLVYSLMTDSSKRPKRASMEAIEPPGTYSKNIYSAFSSRSVPTYRTIFACLKELSRPTYKLQGKIKFLTSCECANIVHGESMRPEVKYEIRLTVLLLLW